MKRFSCGIAAGFVAAVAAVAAAFSVAEALWPERLPAPAISSLAVIDEKLRFLRDRPELDPEVLAVGSSITWRQLSGNEFERTGKGRFLNAGMVKLKAHQTRAMAEFLLDRYPNVRDLVTLVSLPDIENCTDAPLLFDPADAFRYAFEGWPSTYFYLKYFDLHRYARTARTLAEKRVPFMGELYIDDYGSGPIQVPRDSGLALRYSAIQPDPACKNALIELAEKAAVRGVRVTIVFSPIHPDYRDLYPASVKAMAKMIGEIRMGSAVYGTNVVSLFDKIRFTADDFYDAFHLQWDAVDELSELVVAALQPEDRQIVLAGTPSCDNPRPDGWPELLGRRPSELWRDLKAILHRDSA